MENIIKKYKDKIYTKEGMRNLKTMKAIAKEAGLVNPYVFRSPYDFYYINSEPIDLHGGSEEAEVISTYNFCSRMVKRDKQLNRDKKLNNLLG
jgi:hypothetical protein